MSVKTILTAIADRIRSLHGLSGGMSLEMMPVYLDGCRNEVSEQARLLDEAIIALDDKISGVGNIAQDPFKPIPFFTYTVDEIDGASYGFDLNDNGYYESQNKGKSNSYAICRVNLVVNNTCDVVFDVINYAEAGYDYAIFGNLDSALVLSSGAESEVKQNFKGQNNGSVVNVVYNAVTPGNHFVDIKFIKDFSNDRNNDSVQFKIQPCSWKLSQTTINKILNADEDLKSENIKSGVDIFGVLGTFLGSTSGTSGIPSGIHKISTGTITPNSDIIDDYTVDHDLGIVPTFAILVLCEDASTATVQGGRIMCFQLYKPIMSNSVVYSMRGAMLYGGNSGSVSTVSIYGDDFATETTVKFKGHSIGKLKAGSTYRWVCGILDDIQ